MLAFSHKISKIIFVTIISSILCITLISCTNDNDATNNSCEQAMKTASEISDMQDTVEDVDPAIQECGSMQEFISASSKFPKALDGIDEETFVTNRCTYNSSLQNTAICKSIIE